MKILLVLCFLLSLVACKDDFDYTDTVTCSDGTVIKDVHAYAGKYGTIYTYKPHRKSYMDFPVGSNCRIIH